MSTSFDQDRAARDARAVDQIVHAIETTQQRRLAATRWTDEGGDSARRNLQVHVVQNLHGRRRRNRHRRSSIMAAAFHPGPDGAGI